ncbi:MAG: hypothetical protein AB1642_01425 [Pseudomonadota bacterium]
MNLDLPATGTAQPPLFVDAEQCGEWCAALQLTNPIQTQAQLLRQLHLLNCYTLAAAPRLAILELLRAPIHFVQEESAKKFTGKPLPLAAPEQAAFDTAHGLWQALALGYLRCLDACLNGDVALLPQAALVCQRALAALVGDQADLTRAGRQPDDEHWGRVHAVLAAADRLDATTTAVTDPLRGGAAPTVTDAYVESMLLAAANLHELTPRQQGWAMRWARRWAGKVVIHPAPPPESPALPLCVDLASAEPARFKPYTGSGARWLDTAELRKSLKKRLKLLAEGGEANTPEQLGLGRDCQQPACGDALRRVYPRWVKGGVLRRHERHPMHGACRFVVGVDAIHYYLSGSQPFKPPGSASVDVLRRQREELATFGRFATRFEEEYSRDHGYQLENWEIVEDWGMLDQSNGGLRLERPLKQAGGRLGIGQLVAVQPANANGLLLGAVRWAQTTGASLVTGIQMFPGRPVPVAVRGTGVMAEREAYRPGFLLPPVEALELPACVVLPPGSHKPGRIMEAWTPAASQRLRLKEVIDRGADFERVACETMPD